MGEVDEALLQLTEIEDEKFEKEMQERIEEVDTLEEKYMEYILDEEDREII